MDQELRELARLFAEHPRPATFTNVDHCSECAEHHEELAPHTPETIERQHLGHPGWDPITFATDEAFLYYLPGLARVAATARGEAYYLDQFLSHVERHATLLSPAERVAVATLLRSIRNRLADDIASYRDEDELEKVIGLLVV